MIIRKIKNNIEILLFFFVIIIDQISKVMIFDYFGNNLYVRQINLLPILNLVFVWNYGISFGIFNNPEQNQVLFLIISGVIILFLSYCYFKEKYINRISISLIISGAIGNIIDRIHYGAVLDFIDFHIYSYHWPAFNIADSAIVIGGFLIIFFNEKLSH